MEFKSLKNIQTAFSQIRLYIIVFALLCVAITAYALYASYNFAREQREKIYVLDQGKSLMLALSQDASRNVLWKHANMSDVSTSFSLALLPTRMLLSKIWHVPLRFVINRLLIITRIWQKRVISIVPSRAM